MRKLVTLLIALLVGLSLAQQDNLDATLLEGLAANEDFSTLVGLIDQAGLTDALSGAGPFTLFAPDNNVFQELNPDILDQLNNDPALLKSVLQSHVVQGAYGILDLRNAPAGSIMTLNGDPLEINLDAGGLKVDGADLVSTDVENTYSNGVLNQVGDLVLSTSLKSQLGISDTEEATSDPGVFGGTFADYDTNADGVLTQDEIDTGLYTRYDVNGDGIIDQSEYDAYPGVFGGTFADYDTNADGGLTQDEYQSAYDGSSVFDSLDANGSGDIDQTEYDANPNLLGLGTAGAAVTGAAATVVGAATGGAVTGGAVTGGAETGGAAMGADTGGAETGGAMQMGTETVVELLTNDGRFGTLLTAINDAGLADSLQQNAPFTLFAPTDDAFAALPDADRTNILGNADMLKNLLLYHVVPGEVTTATLTADGQATTLEGTDITVTSEANGNVSLNDGQANVAEADLAATDGVVHVIDGVLLPASMVNQ